MTNLKGLTTTITESWHIGWRAPYHNAMLSQNSSADMRIWLSCVSSTDSQVEQSPY